MADLSNWIMVQAYTGQQAAALVFGLDPGSDDLAVTAGLLQRMKNAYSATLWAHQAVALPRIERKVASSVKTLFPSIEADRDPFDLHYLHSWRMTAYYDEVCDREDIEFGVDDLLVATADSRFSEWLDDDQQTDFDKQLFDPHELRVWLKFSKLESKFEFFRQPEKSAASAIRQDVPLKIIKSRRNVLDPVIELAQSLCRDSNDDNEVWTRLQKLAHDESPPLKGADEGGIKYLNADDQPKYLTLKALKMRIHRACKAR